MPKTQKCKIKLSNKKQTLCFCYIMQNTEFAFCALEILDVKEKALLNECFHWSGLRVSEIKTTECCFYERCETKQGVEGESLRPTRNDYATRRDLELVRAPMLYSQKKKKALTKECLHWSGLRGSNPPPPPWQGGALPNELNPQVFNSRSVRAVMIVIKSWRLGWGSVAAHYAPWSPSALTVHRTVIHYLLCSSGNVL